MSDVRPVLERLYLEIWTDGTMEPSDALSQSARLLTELLNPFANFGQVIEVKAEKERYNLSIPQELYNMPVEQLNLVSAYYELPAARQYRHGW